MRFFTKMAFFMKNQVLGVFRYMFLSALLAVAMPVNSASSDFYDPVYRKAVIAYENQDEKLAIEVATPLAESGHEGAMFILANIYWGNEDYEQGWAWHVEAAEHGVPLSQHIIGVEYYHGGFVERDFELAEHWLKKAAKANLHRAQYVLGYMYYSGDARYGKDIRNAHKWLLLAADAGNALAQANLGLMYHFGDLGKPDHISAIRWYEKAAKQGIGTAELGLAEIYEDGLSVPADLEKALSYYSEAWCRRRC